MKIKHTPAPTTIKETPVKLTVGKKKILIHTIHKDSGILALEYRSHRVEVIRGDTLAALKAMEKIISKL